jgi:hypothetical protein
MENETAQDAGTEAVADNQTRGKIDRALPGPIAHNCQAPIATRFKLPTWQPAMLLSQRLRQGSHVIPRSLGPLQ